MKGETLNKISVSANFDAEIYTLSDLDGGIIETFTNYQELSDYCNEHSLDLTKVTGLDDDETRGVSESWYVASTGNHQGLVISEGDGRNVAVTYDKKDAHIIAAAPDMLEALKAVRDDWHSRNSNYYKKEPKFLQTVRAAIAKATNNQ